MFIRRWDLHQPRKCIIYDHHKISGLYKKWYQNCNFKDCFEEGGDILDFEESLLDRDFADEDDYDLSKLLNDKQSIKVIFKSKLTCTALAGLSLVNLYWSIKQFKEIHLNLKEKIEKIKSYKNRLEEIRKQFEDHTKDIIIFDNDDYNNFINNVKKSEGQCSK